MWAQTTSSLYYIYVHVYSSIQQQASITFWTSECIEHIDLLMFYYVSHYSMIGALQLFKHRYADLIVQIAYIFHEVLALAKSISHSITKEHILQHPKCLLNIVIDTLNYQTLYETHFLTDSLLNIVGRVCHNQLQETYPPFT